MQKCEFKKGIFVQRACGEAAFHNCKSCGINVCLKHSRPIKGSNNELLCHACYISEYEIDESKARVRYLDSDKEFSLWYSSFRIEHTHSRRMHLFDESDYNEFDVKPMNEQVYLEDDNGFFDS